MSVCLRVIVQCPDGWLSVSMGGRRMYKSTLDQLGFEVEELKRSQKREEQVSTHIQSEAVACRRIKPCMQSAKGEQTVLIQVNN